MKPQPPRGPQARYTRMLHTTLAQRKAALREAVELLAPLWAGDMEQLAAALDRLQLASPLRVDLAALEQLALATQEHAAAQARRLLAAAPNATRQDAKRPASTLQPTLWEEDPAIQEAARRWAEENARLVEGLDAFTRQRIFKAVREAGAGSTLRDLIALLIEQLGASRRRAALIARDQVGKLAADTARERMERAGVTSYIWRSVDDERTRPEHRKRDGKTFEWALPPKDGHPGEAPLCRCYAEPILDDDSF